MNIVVLAGGLSTERTVSLSSASKICKSLRKSGHHAILVDSFFGVEELPANIKDAFLSQQDFDFSVEEQEPDLAAVRASRVQNGFGSIGPNVLELCRAADIVYMGLHGENGENGRMQAMFDVLEIRYTGCGYLASALAMNKELTKQIFLQNGILTPRGTTFSKGDPFSRLDGFSVPCIVKPCSGGSSIGLYVVNDRSELQHALDDALRYEDVVLVEEFIKGREFSVGVLDRMALPPIEIIPKGGIYDYAHKYQAGWTQEICPADIDDDTAKLMQTAALRVADVLGLEVYSRMDFILTEDHQAYCLEANTLPGMTPTSLIPQEAAAAGIGYDELCRRVIELSCQKYEHE